MQRAAGQRGWAMTFWRAASDPTSRRNRIERSAGFVEALPSSFFGSFETTDPATLLAQAQDAYRILLERRQEAERQAWQNVENGITDPTVSVREADLLISFIRSL